MGYVKKIYRLKTAVEIEEYHDDRHRLPGQPRQPKQKATPEQMAKANRRNREKLCRRKLREHFDIYDVFSTLTYARERRPASMEAATAATSP